MRSRSLDVARTAAVRGATRRFSQRASNSTNSAISKARAPSEEGDVACMWTFQLCKVERACHAIGPVAGGRGHWGAEAICTLCYPPYTTAGPRYSKAGKRASVLSLVGRPIQIETPKFLASLR